MSFQGMDTEGARAHAQRMEASLHQLTGLGQGLGGTIDGVDWQGEDAESFRERWHSETNQLLTASAERLTALVGQLRAQADQQDITSEQDGTETGPAENPGTIPAAPSDENDGGYLNEDDSWLPNWLEDPLEQGFSDLAGDISETVGTGFDTLMDGLISGGESLGRRMDGWEQFQRDAGHWGQSWTDLLTGERVPTIAELGAGGLLTVGSLGVGVYETLSGQDTPFLDDRPGGIIHSVETSTTPEQSAQSLQDLVMGNNGLREGNTDRDLEGGQIGIQQVTSANGGEPVYIVQVPPTETDHFFAMDSWGGQGNSRDWASNLRLVSGQHPAAMDDVVAAMQAPGPDGSPLVPPGANVMFVGHSQGGIVSSHLAADPSFNNTSGDPGTYNVTHSFSVGSPVQTVLPAQGSTEVVNVSHGPVDVGWPTSSGDPIAHSDLQGTQVGGGTLSGPNVHEVVLPGPSAETGMPWLEANHDSVGAGNDPQGGYAGTVGRSTASDPTLSALQRDIDGVYIGPGTVVTRSSVIDVGRGEHP